MWGYVQPDQWHQGADVLAAYASSASSQSRVAWEWARCADFPARSAVSAAATSWPALLPFLPAASPFHVPVGASAYLLRLWPACCTALSLAGVRGLLLVRRRGRGREAGTAAVGRDGDEGGEDEGEGEDEGNCGASPSSNLHPRFSSFVFLAATSWAVLVLGSTPFSNTAEMWLLALAWLLLDAQRRAVSARGTPQTSARACSVAFAFGAAVGIGPFVRFTFLIFVLPAAWAWLCLVSGLLRSDGGGGGGTGADEGARVRGGGKDGEADGAPATGGAAGAGLVKGSAVRRRTRGMVAPATPAGPAPAAPAPAAPTPAAPPSAAGPGGSGGARGRTVAAPSTTPPLAAASARESLVLVCCAAAGGLISVGACIFVDSSFFGVAGALPLTTGGLFTTTSPPFSSSPSLSWARLPLAPLTSALYNSSPANLARHGTHPRWLHLVVNGHILFGPAWTLLGWRVACAAWAAWAGVRAAFARAARPSEEQAPAAESSSRRGAALLLHSFLPSRDALSLGVHLPACASSSPDYGGHRHLFLLSAATVFVGLAVLSLAPHQEPRFLFPLVPSVFILLLMMMPMQGLGDHGEGPRVHVADGARRREAGAGAANDDGDEERPPRWNRLFALSWLIFNLLALVFFSYLHQGGVLPATLALAELRDTGRLPPLSFPASSLFAPPFGKAEGAGVGVDDVALRTPPSIIRALLEADASEGARISSSSHPASDKAAGEVAAKAAPAFPLRPAAAATRHHVRALFLGTYLVPRYFLARRPQAAAAAGAEGGAEFALGGGLDGIGTAWSRSSALAAPWCGVGSSAGGAGGSAGPSGHPFVTPLPDGSVERPAGPGADGTISLKALASTSHPFNLSSGGGRGANMARAGGARVRLGVEVEDAPTHSDLAASLAAYLSREARRGDDFEPHLNALVVAPGSMRAQVRAAVADAASALSVGEGGTAAAAAGGGGARSLARCAGTGEGGLLGPFPVAWPHIGTEDPPRAWDETAIEGWWVVGC